MTTLGEALAIEADAVRKGPRCTIERFGLIKPDLAAELHEALTNPALTSAAISRALTRAGAPIAVHVISRHRRGECTCRKESA